MMHSLTRSEPKADGRPKPFTSSSFNSFSPEWNVNRLSPGVTPARLALTKADRHAEAFAAYPSGFVALRLAKSEYSEVRRALLEANQKPLSDMSRLRITF